MSKKENSRSGCRYCLHGIKKYLSIGNKLFYKGALGCYKSPTEIIKGADFEEKDACELFEPDRMHEPKNNTEKMITYLYNQLEDVIGLLFDILEILNPDEDDDNAQKCAEDNNTDE